VRHALEEFETETAKNLLANNYIHLVGLAISNVRYEDCTVNDKTYPPLNLGVPWDPSRCATDALLHACASSNLIVMREQTYKAYSECAGIVDAMERNAR